MSGGLITPVFTDREGNIIGVALAPDGCQVTFYRTKDKTLKRKGRRIKPRDWPMFHPTKQEAIQSLQGYSGLRKDWKPYRKSE